MQHFDNKGASIPSLQEALGKTLEAQIRQQGFKKGFAKKAGIHRDTLRRLLIGKNVSTDVLFRVLRALGRFDLIESLLLEPGLTPLQRLGKAESTNKDIPSGSLLDKLKTARKEENDE